MIDLKLLSDDFEATAARLVRKRVPIELVRSARDLAESRRQVVREVDDARQEMNAGSQSVGRLMREGRREEADALRAGLADSRGRIEALEARRREVEEALDDVVARIPNIPDDVVPDGTSEDDNRVVRTHGYDPADYEGRSYEPHWEVAGRLGIYDGERAAKLSGGMFSVLRGGGARLLRGLVDFALDLHKDRYLEIAPPHAVRSDVITRTGHLTKFESQAYKLRDDDLWLIPTGEVPLMGMHQDEILPEADLPLRYMAYTVCWRREAGAAGKDTRGMQRLHEFHKVELAELCRPEDSDAELAALLGDCERSLQTLGLPYRVVELCAGDLTFSASRVFDLEVYSPGVDRWLEVSSVSLVTDFQARRGAIRYRKEGGGTAFVHTLNGSGLATPRVWSAIVEHGQQPDGTVRVPAALVPYVGTEVIAG
ncbi:serine--tRNA ligase [Acidiferrimicrobium sp. IK]|uniref:serine--tRNA ligase n=1 Tax=Acidiferrimicrobium sp. IK TaxID=2871700 RepID=UPI0021CB287D|nr:serine--tRNA ligase [Acidiferrimicrobium sp. IK]MCU4186963.1 serine--tRNA ligase [Acidiferrimicrobium sp. IK]